VTLAFNSRRGSALLVALCFSTVLALGVTSYIVTASRALQLSNREFQQNRLNQLAEAGIEEALWELNVNRWSATSWTLSGTTYSRNFTGYSYGQGVTGEVLVTVTNINTTTPTITSAATLTLQGGTILTRTLRATTAPMPLFYNALAGLSTTSSRAVRFQRSGFIDSYNSALGDYNATTNRSDRAVISGRTLVLNNSETYGFMTIPNASNISRTASARLYGVANAASPIWDATRISGNMFQPVLTVTSPTGTSTALSSWISSDTTLGTAGATTSTLYTGGDLNISSGVTVTIDGPVIFDLAGILYIWGNSSTGGRIVVTSNGRLEIHLAGALTISGRGIENQTRRPRNVIIFGSDLGSDTNAISTNAHTSTNPLYAVFFMPNDTMSISGAPFHLRGSMIANRIDFTNTSATTANFPRINYDLSLRTEVFPNVDTPQLINQVTVL
jgi:hypothetical protein